MKIIDKLTTYASLIGVIGAIGGGFYAWGEFNTRLSSIENSGNVNELKVDMVDRISAIEDKLDVTIRIRLGIDPELGSDVEEIQKLLNDIKKDVAIVKKENELQDSKD